jgi:cytochrome c2
MSDKTVCIALVVAMALVLSSCFGDVNGVPEPRSVSESSVANGRRLIASYGCGACHTIPGVPGADAMVAPPLNRFYERSYISGEIPNTWDNLIEYLRDPQKIEPGTVMPNLGISEDEARDIAAYLYHQQTPIDWIRR